jgi:sec-independent protein translocase protein TatC
VVQKTSTPEDPTLFEHLFEIRTRLIRCLAVFLGASLVCYLRAGDMFDFLAAPAEGHLVFTHPVGAMMAYMKLGFMAGLIVSSPYIFYQVFAFLQPAMNPAWRRTVTLSLVVGYLLFGLGVAFSLKTLPLAMHFLLSYARPGLQAMINVDQYFSFVFLITFGSGFAFEMPLLMYFLAAGGFISSATLVKQWRMAIMACLILGAVICPTPDLVTWALVCLPLFGLYLVSIGVVRWAEGARRKRVETA